MKRKWIRKFSEADALLRQGKSMFTAWHCDNKGISWARIDNAYIQMNVIKKMMRKYGKRWVCIDGLNEEFKVCFNEKCSGNPCEHF